MRKRWKRISCNSSRQLVRRWCALNRSLRPIAERDDDLLKSRLPTRRITMYHKLFVFVLFRLFEIATSTRFLWTVGYGVIGRFHIHDVTEFDATDPSDRARISNHPNELFRWAPERFETIRMRAAIVTKATSDDPFIDCSADWSDQKRPKKSSDKSQI